MNISQVIVKPVLTEKSVQGELANKFTFIVHEDATKIDVKQAIQQLFGAKVADVNIKKGLPKFRIGRGRKPMLKRSTSRQAIVTLKAGEKIDITKLTDQAEVKETPAKKTTKSTNKSD